MTVRTAIIDNTMASTSLFICSFLLASSGAFSFRWCRAVSRVPGDYKTIKDFIILRNSLASRSLKSSQLRMSDMSAQEKLVQARNSVDDIAQIREGRTVPLSKYRNIGIMAHIDAVESLCFHSFACITDNPKSSRARPLPQNESYTTPARPTKSAKCMKEPLRWIGWSRSRREASR